MDRDQRIGMTRARRLGGRALAMLIAAAAAGAQDTAPAVAPAGGPLAVAVVGASISKGLAWRDYEGWSSEPDPLVFAEKHLGRVVEDREYALRTDGIGLADALGRVVGSAVQVRDESNEFAFRNPERAIGLQLRRAARHAKLIVGLDLLAWFALGPVPGAVGETEAERAADRQRQRLERLERGLALVARELDGRDCDLVVGNLPDLAGADELLLPEHSRPTAAGLAALNDRIRAWVDARPRVHLYDIAARLAQARQGRLSVSLGPRIALAHTDQMLQLDELHPNRLGMAYLVQDVIAQLSRDLPGRTDGWGAADYPAILRAVGASPADIDYLGALHAARSR